MCHDPRVKESRPHCDGVGTPREPHQDWPCRTFLWINSSVRPERRVHPPVVREAHVIVGTRAGAGGIRPRIVQVVHRIQEWVPAGQLHTLLNQRHGQGTRDIISEEKRR